MQGAKEFYSRNHQQSQEHNKDQMNEDQIASEDQMDDGSEDFTKVEKNQKTITDFFKKS